ncbi:nuclear transport factor 2 family protein [Streptomyces poonensis]|uniref:SnoaL-like domain-containing protein n=1 Tax=Streptomyces poonensis TaxID=68255 RepID=A0A918Q2B4_9ACTN|nr:nuclear transport factor 2 family protein [Streptomyces poonensis]GGZ29324.1 hypothetical protein GCM10010365_57070 [Streptomyces poonensis]
MSTYEAAHRLGKQFHTLLVSGDWNGLRELLTDDATWTLPGDNAVSGTVNGPGAIADHAQKIASYGVNFELLHILVSRENVALSVHNTARRGDVVLDQYLSAVCRLRDCRIAAIETYLSDVPGMDAFFV